MPSTTASRSGSAELAAVAPIARLFGADTIWLPGDAAFDRFRTPRPELTAELFAGGSDDLGAPVDVRRAGRQRTAGADGRRAVAVRAGGRHGDRPGRPRPSRRSRAHRPRHRPRRPAVGEWRRPRRRRRRRADRRRRGDPLQRIVVRRRAGRGGRHGRRSWSSPTPTGAAPTTGGVPRTSPATPSRRPVRRPCGTTPAMPASTSSPTRRRRRLHGGGPGRTRRRSRASSYGERFSYLPEARPAMAVDGDPNTAWTVLDPAGQYLEVTTSRRASTTSPCCSPTGCATSGAWRRSPSPWTAASRSTSCSTIAR